MGVSIANRSGNETGGQETVQRGRANQKRRERTLYAKSFAAEIRGGKRST